MTIAAFAPIPVENVLGPLKAISNLAADKAGRLANIQLTALETYLAVGINQCKAAAAVHGPEDIQTLATKQAELARILGEKALMDLQQIMLLGTEFGAQIQSAVLESSQAAMPAAR